MPATHAARLRAGLWNAAFRLRVESSLNEARRRRRGEPMAFLRLRALLEDVLRPDSCCVDVGAYRGNVLRVMAACAPRGRHVAFEPLPHLCARLRRELPQVDVRCTALADFTGEADFVHVRSRPAYSGLRTRRFTAGEVTERVVVPVARLDDALPPGYAPDLVKIDVEGAQALVLEGAVETLRRHRPVVVFEHGRQAEVAYGTGSDRVFDALVEGAGLRVFDLAGGPPLERAAFCERVEAGASIDYVARP